MFKVIIAGSRGFNDYKLLCEVMDVYLHDKMDDIEIVSGTAKGADRLGERYARDRKYKISRFPANWKNLTRPGAIIRENGFGKYDSGAGHFRNKKMAEHADAAVVFLQPGATNKGSMNMYETMDELGKPSMLVNENKT